MLRASVLLLVGAAAPYRHCIVLDGTKRMSVTRDWRTVTVIGFPLSDLVGPSEERMAVAVAREGEMPIAFLFDMDCPDVRHLSEDSPEVENPPNRRKTAPSEG